MKTRIIRSKTLHFSSGSVDEKRLNKALLEIHPSDLIQVLQTQSSVYNTDYGDYPEMETVINITIIYYTNNIEVE